MGNNERHPKAIKPATLYGLAGAAAVLGGFGDLVSRTHLSSTDMIPYGGYFYTFKDRVAQYGEGNAAILDLLVMFVGFAAIARSAILSETPQPLPKRSPLAGKEFPYDTYDVEKS